MSWWELMRCDESWLVMRVDERWWQLMRGYARCLRIIFNNKGSSLQTATWSRQTCFYTYAKSTKASHQNVCKYITLMIVADILHSKSIFYLLKGTASILTD